ncbi:hypothetical protein GT370_09290 [Acidocella sp. MX-AZ03]|nr:hypothetical protein [Acidocella sp. MX-AZ03]WBO60894.1 hypothetical protein GT370_09290 [Acidocella sp. MX-AZ03]
MNQAQALIPNSPAPLVLRGEIELSGNDWRAALADQNAALALAPMTIPP